ncbi:MAG: 2Fe-2S iron-sulfur cluster-binding protein [Pseudobdellovibrionaceae bacterium]
MPVISFAKKHRESLKVIPGVNLMTVLLENDIPVASSCHGDGVCAKCRLQITKGAENLSQANETEIFLKEKFQLKSGQRISCQSYVLGDIEIDAGYW